MAETNKVQASRSGGRRSIDAGMAALAALSVGFFGYAMPADVARGLIGASRIAEPGSSARYAVIAGVAALAFILVYALLRALGRVPAAAKSAVDIPADPPRIRRADAHPDAPARWPLFAGSELGDPIPAEEVEEVDAASEELELRPEEIIADDVEAAPETVADAFETPVAEEPEATEVSESPMLGLLGGGIEISEGEPVERPIADEAELDHPLPSFIAPPAAAAPAEPVAAEAAVEPTEAPALVEADAEPVADVTPDVAEPVDESVEPEAESDPTIEDAPYIDEWVAPDEAAAAAVEAEAEEALEAPITPAEDEPTPVADTAFVAATWEDPFAEAEEEAAPKNGEETLVPTEYKPAPAVSEAEPTEADPVEAAPAAVEPAPQHEPVTAIAARILPEPRDESVSQLMGRLEVGLGRRDRAQWLGDPDPAADGDAPTDDRLRNALGMLKRMAGRKS